MNRQDGITEAEKLLMGSEYEPFIGSLKEITFRNYVNKNVFKMGNSYLGKFILKIRKNDEENVINSINILEKIIDTENLINKNTGIIKKDKFILLISKQLEGIQPIESERDKLHIFFSKLAAFNKNNIIDGPFSSMYLDGNYFNSIEELVDREINSHVKYFYEDMDSKKILSTLEILKQGIPCIINEDMNCGNLFITSDGKYKIIDTEWILKSVNLFQFQHVDYFGFDERNWYTITDRARECYEAYFDTLGIGDKKANEQIRAVELLNLLRENTFNGYYGKERDKEINMKIEKILRNEKFI